MSLALQGDSWKFLKAVAPAVLGLLALLILAIVLFRWVRKRFLDHADRTTDELAMLSEIRELRARGELTEEEFRSIKGRLIGKSNGPAAATPPEANERMKDER